MVPGGWEQRSALREALVEVLWPLLAAACTWAISAHAARRANDTPAARLGLSGNDNRARLGPALVVVFCAQTVAHAMLLGLRLSGGDGTQPALTPAFALLQWALATAVASRQLIAYLRSMRHRHVGLFGHGVLAFVVASLCASLAQAYFAFFVPSRWTTPMVGRGVSSESLLLEARLALNAAAVCVLLTLRKLPEPSSPAALTAVPGELERLLGLDCGDAYSALQARERLLSPDDKIRRPSSETGDSILQNTLFCWVGQRI
ncbi:hypothetical protein IWQ57_002330, partial [Coemansia nantahalensis]